MVRRAAFLLLIALLSPPAAAQIEVDVELALMVDVSRSMTARELEIQRRGYAEALASPDVVEAIGRGMLGQVAVSYVEWAGAGSQRTIVDWRLLATRDDARAFADALTLRFDPGLSRTSISSALDHAVRSIETNNYQGLRRVIDMSGDGPNNQGREVARARDAALGAGLVINGLPLMTREGLGGQWDLADLDLYYRDCVIGGPGAFVIPVTDWAQFAEAVRRKLVLELAGEAPVAVVPVQGHPPFDCLVGEKIWDRNRPFWNGP